jgi:ribonucleoside-diphosphate reductase alpha chain
MEGASPSSTQHLSRPAGVPDLPRETLDAFGRDELRARVFHDKYALRDRSGAVVERTPDQMWHRIARELASVEAPDRREEWTANFRWLLEDFRFIPGGRIMHAAGNHRRVTALNCYVIPVKDDSIESIFDWMKEAARTYSLGGGVGTDISVLRPRGAPVNNAARSSTGSVSFMELFSLTTGTIGQSGRRGALMITIADNHPDVLDFIKVKRNRTRVRYANISVRVSDAFMRAVEEDGSFDLAFENERATLRRTVRARELWQELIQGARDYAEPGIIFWDAVKRWSTSEYNAMGVVTTNPCSLVGSTYVMTPSGIHRLDALVSQAVTDRVSPEVVIDRRAADRQGLAAVKADALAFTGVKRIYRVETSSGFVVRGTGDHKVKVLNDDTYDPHHGSTGWKRIDELQPGDVLAVMDLNDPSLVETIFRDRSPYLHLDAERIQPRRHDAHYRLVDIPEVWDEDLAYLLGYAVGDGSYTRHSSRAEHANRLDVHMHVTDAPFVKPIVDRVTARCLRYRRERVPAGGGTVVAEIDYPLQTREGTNRAWMSIHSAAFLRMLWALGLKPAVAREKAVPESILTAPKEATASFLRGLFDADGTISRPSERPMVSLSSTSRTLIQQVQLLLGQFGVFSTISVHPADAKNAARASGLTYLTKDGEPREYQSVHDSYRLCIGGFPSIERFAEHIGSALPRKQQALDALRASPKMALRRVTSVTRVARVVDEGVSEPVYDLTVLDTKSFIANGLVVSNSEIPLEPYGCCCLGNLSLARFVRDEFTSQARVDWEQLERALRYATRFLDNVLDYNADKHPLPQQSEASLYSRRIGVGFTGLGDMLIMLGLRYDTEAAVSFVDGLFDRIKHTVYDESVNLAVEKGAFPGYDAEQHARSPFVQALAPRVRERIARHGLRNVALLTVPPVGSGAALAGVTSGIEPIFDLSYIRRSESLSQELFTVYHPLVRDYMRRFGVEREEDLPDHFVTAHQIQPEMRVKMQAAIQRHIDHAISSTVNLPHDVPPEEVERIYFLAWKLGCKGMTVYRAGSRENILTAMSEKRPSIHHGEQSVAEGLRSDRAAADPPPRPAGEHRARTTPRPRPKVTSGRTERIETPRGRIYVVINEDEMGICEIFVHSLDVEAEAIGRMASLALRGGLDAREVIEQLWRVQSTEVAFDRSSDGNVVRVSTIAQAVALALGRALYGDAFRPDKAFPRADALPEPGPRARQESLRFGPAVSPPAAPADPALAPVSGGTGLLAGNGHEWTPEVAIDLEFVGICPDCGASLIRENGCATCRQCGYARC